MDANELLAAISRVRRAMPRNWDVMNICDAAERSLIQKSTPTPPDAPPAKFDRKAYQRDLMRKRRAEGKA